MQAPDTIYIPIVEEEGKKLLCTNWWETDTSSRNAYVNETIPYIRKEALLEWANGMMDCFAPGGDCSQTLQMVIKHIESL